MDGGEKFTLRFFLRFASFRLVVVAINRRAVKSPQIFDRSFLSRSNVSFPSDILSTRENRIQDTQQQDYFDPWFSFRWNGKIHRLSFNERLLEQFCFHFRSPRESKIDQGRSKRGARERNRTEIKLSLGEGERVGTGKRNVGVSVNRILSGRRGLWKFARVVACLPSSVNRPGTTMFYRRRGGRVEAVGSVVTFVTRRELQFLFVSRHVCSASIFYIPLAPNFYLFVRKISPQIWRSKNNSPIRYPSLSLLLSPG